MSNSQTGPTDSIDWPSLAFLDTPSEFWPSSLAADIELLAWLAANPGTRSTKQIYKRRWMHWSRPITSAFLETAYRTIEYLAIASRLQGVEGKQARAGLADVLDPLESIRAFAKDNGHLPPEDVMNGLVRDCIQRAAEHASLQMAYLAEDARKGGEDLGIRSPRWANLRDHFAHQARLSLGEPDDLDGLVTDQ